MAFIVLTFACKSTADSEKATLHSSQITELSQKYEGKPLADFFKKYGESNQDVGSGIQIYSYTTSDGKKIGVGSNDGKTILYVKDITNMPSAAKP